MSEQLNFEDIEKALDAWEEPEDFIINTLPCGCTISMRGIWTVCKTCHGVLKSDAVFQKAMRYGTYHGVKVVVPK